VRLSSRPDLPSFPVLNGEHMDQEEESHSPALVTNRAMDITVAAILMAFGALVMWDSYRLGMTWGLEGPRAGYFPFRVGSLIVISSAITLVLSATRRAENGAFVRWHQFRLVLQVLIPTAVFVFAIGYIGIYLAMAIFIAMFMWWHGRFSVVRIAPVAILVPIALFFMFEIWFLVPLPKGPIEEWLNL
jgi:putative tricarboxylic transport membrane protein